MPLALAGPLTYSHLAPRYCIDCYTIDQFERPGAACKRYQVWHLLLSTPSTVSICSHPVASTASQSHTTWKALVQHARDVKSSDSKQSIHKSTHPCFLDHGGSIAATF